MVYSLCWGHEVLGPLSGVVGVQLAGSVAPSIGELSQ